MRYHRKIPALNLKTKLILDPIICKIERIHINHIDIATKKMIKRVYPILVTSGLHH